MVVRGVEDIQVVQEQAALLAVAMLVARDEPLDRLFGAVAGEVVQMLGSEAAAVMRFIGGERAVIVGVHRVGGVRGLPVNAELDFHRTRSAIGLAQSTLLPARLTYDEDSSGDVPKLMKAVGLRATAVAPILHHSEPWGAVLASAADEEALPPGCERRLVGLAALIGQALVNADARAELAASRTRLVEAGDEARRRLERALHEGAHQHVVALALKLRVACGRATPGSQGGGAAGRGPRRCDGGERGVGRAGPRPASRGALRARAGGGTAGAGRAGAAARPPARAPRPALCGGEGDDRVPAGGGGDRQRGEARARHGVHAARGRPGRHADGRGSRQRHRRREAPPRRWSGVRQPTVPRRSAGASRSCRPAAAGRPSGSRSRLTAEGWRYSFGDQIRYGDLDTNAHLNNVAVHGFFESARVAYMRALFPEIDPMGRAGGFGMIFAETHVRFASPGFYEEHLRVDVRPEELRRSSVKIAFRMVCDRRRPAASPRAGGRWSATTTSTGAPRRLERHRRAPAHRDRNRVTAGMSYGLTFEAPAAESVERTRREQLEAAAEGLAEGHDDDPVGAVHDARKRIKKTRALLRLARPGLKKKAYRRRNRALRDAGRAMSGARDADVLAETVDVLAERFVGQLPGASSSPAPVSRSPRARRPPRRAGDRAQRGTFADPARARGATGGQLRAG